jgi:hypothetical protein
MSGSQLIPTNTFATQSGNIALSLLDTNFSQVASFLNNPNNYTNYLVDSGGANAYVVTFPTGVIPSSYTAGLTVVMKVANANTGASTLNVNSLGTKNILTPSGGALSSGTLSANAIVMVVYDGTQFILVGGSTSTTGTSIANGTSNVTIASSNGAITAATNGITAVTIDTSQNVTLNNVIPSGSSVPSNGMFLPTTNTVGFSTATTERMRIDSSGNLAVGDTNNGSTGWTTSRLYVNGGYTQLKNSDGPLLLWNTTNSGTRTLVIFDCTVGSTRTDVGSITYNGTTTLYNSTSDQRLKENIVDAGTALETVGQIKIRAFDWIESKVHEPHGVIAQELKEIAPQCVTEGTNHEDGSMDRPWQVDTSPLIPMLIKGIQEQQATINALTARVVALESK